jgi:hypothetical protein
MGVIREPLLSLSLFQGETKHCRALVKHDDFN